MSDKRYRRQRPGKQNKSDSQYLEEMDQAKYAGSLDIVSAENEAKKPGVPGRVDKEDYYGDFYDSIKPDVKKLTGTLSRTILFNGDTYDRQRSNEDIIFFEKQNYNFPALQNESQKITNFNARGAIIIVDGLDVNIGDDFYMIVEGREPGSGNWYNILLTPAMTTAKLFVYKIYPGLNPNPGFTTNDILPRSFRVVVRHVSVNPINYGISGSLIL